MSHNDAPIDATSAAQLASRGLRYELLDTSDSAAFETWLQTMVRGFHSPTVDDEGVTNRIETLADHRTTGVWDDTAADPASPVASVASWITDLTLPGATTVESWAISAVTVAPTHRRRGIARGLLEGELRTAASLGVPVAILTVSEATIYSRYGFAPAAMAATWTVDVRRAQWIGPVPGGRIHLVPAEVVQTGGVDIRERARLQTPGQIFFDGHHWQRLFAMPGTDDHKHNRVVRYDDESGTPQGFAVYRVNPGGSEHHDELRVKHLSTATDDAYAALWKYLLEIDLIDSVVAPLRPVDEPLIWQLADARAASKSNERDHLWVRILDAKAALEARRYAAPGRLVIDIADPLGFTPGRFSLNVDSDGLATVTATDDAADLTMSVVELSALYLGGVRATTLARAGRVTETVLGAAAIADGMLRSDVSPWLNIWF
jgi:predicted acetyltransferase